MQPDPAPLETPPANPVATLEEAVNRMVAIDAELALDDGLRYFNLLYLEVTREAVRWVGGGQLEDPRFLEHLAVLFSNAYFRAVEDFEQVAANGASQAWAPLFAARFDRRVAPIQFALAGMNAHINYDLPIGVRETCRAFGLTPEDDTPHHQDYLRLNAILADVQESGEALARDRATRRDRPRLRSPRRRRRRLQRRPGARRGLGPLQGPMVDARGPSAQLFLPTCRSTGCRASPGTAWSSRRSSARGLGERSAVAAWPGEVAPRGAAGSLLGLLEQAG